MAPKVTQAIAAIATPPGRGGVGIVRISGPDVSVFAEQIAGLLPQPRQALLRDFRDQHGDIIDSGLLLYFPAPHSFTGEHVLELQGHGGPVVMDMLLQRVLSLGARLARPGEFSERAFLNDKMDLAQAEAIADLIDSETQAAARLASRSLQGEFSKRVHALVDSITRLRMYVEAAIDFPEEEIDFLSDGRVEADLESIINLVQALQKSAHTGQLLRDGMKLVIAGLPNAGKSSLLNALSGADRAIVTEVPGTTRDVLREQIQIDGMPLHLIDTAGLRESSDLVEKEGIRRTRSELDSADHILWVFDSASDPLAQGLQQSALPTRLSVTLIANKLDQTDEQPRISDRDGLACIHLSAKKNIGVDNLRNHLKQVMGYTGPQEGDFIARRRHLDAIARTDQHLQAGKQALLAGISGELLAEDLRQAQLSLSEITGVFSADDLLGEIFSSFCIGK